MKNAAKSGSIINYFGYMDCVSHENVTVLQFFESRSFDTALVCEVIVEIIGTRNRNFLFERNVARQYLGVSLGGSLTSCYISWHRK